MEKGSRGASCRTTICGIVVLLSATAFSCSLAAEFHKVKEKDMKLDGGLCFLPKSSAFELGVAAIAFLSLAQLVGTTAAATTMCTCKSSKSVPTGDHVASVALLVLSWVSFALAVILLATAAGMNNGQRYGQGWMDGDCYVAKNGVFGGAAALVVVTALLIIGLTSATKLAAATMTAPTTTAASCATTIRLDAATTADAEQPGGRSKQLCRPRRADRIGHGDQTGRTTGENAALSVPQRPSRVGHAF